MRTNISIHPLRGEWDVYNISPSGDYEIISIHPLRGEWDAVSLYAEWAVKKFQSTHSVGSGTITFSVSPLFVIISIHPLRGEWD